MFITLNTVKKDGESDGPIEIVKEAIIALKPKNINDMDSYTILYFNGGTHFIVQESPEEIKKLLKD